MTTTTDFSMDPSFLESIGIDPSSVSLSSTDLSALGLDPSALALTGLTSGIDLHNLADLGVQDLGISQANIDSANKTLSNLVNSNGGYTSQWQTVGADKVMIQDDGSGIGLNTETGESYPLTQDQVNKMVSSGVLNTAASGYNAATGGTNIAPGGGSVTTNSDGSKTILLPSGATQTIDSNGNVIKSTTASSSSGGGTSSSVSSMLPLLAAAGVLGSKAAGSSGSSTTGSTFIPTLTASRPALNYTPPKAGEANVQYFSPVTYAAEGGQMHGGISTLGSYSDGGHLLKGPGDGVSDSIPATIGGHQPARLADGEFVIPARIVSELGNGSTDAGARKLYAMMDRIKKARSKAKDIAADTKAEKHLPA
jgi:uncharacterized lipoprotein NlpE involved in copper resistance